VTGRRHDVVTVGLTGGIGAGKSTALSMFADLGALTFSADQVVHELYETEGCKAVLVGHFGPEILTERGRVDRQRLASLVQQKPEELRWLEGLTHPLVRERMQSLVDEAPAGSVLVFEIPLLFEAGFEGDFDLVVTVEASDATRRRRSPHRFGPELFSQLEALQASSERRQSGSHLAFMNEGDLRDLRTFVEEAYRKATGLLARRLAAEGPARDAGTEAEP